MVFNIKCDWVAPSTWLRFFWGAAAGLSPVVRAQCRADSGPKGAPVVALLCAVRQPALVLRATRFNPCRNSYFFYLLSPSFGLESLANLLHCLHQKCRSLASKSLAVYQNFFRSFRVQFGLWAHFFFSFSQKLPGPIQADQI